MTVSPANDHYAPPTNRAAVERTAYAWRDALGVAEDCLQPDMIDLLEIQLPQLLPMVSFVVEPDNDLDGVEAYTDFEPPQIVVRESVYRDGILHRHRARFTLAHEFGHLTQHRHAQHLHRAPAEHLRGGRLRPFASAEWQANTFASAFLMPSWLIEQFENATDASRALNVSIQAAGHRLDQLGSLVRRKTLDIM